MIEIIKEYAIAHKEAEDNPRLLIEDWEKNRDICVKRMERVSNADAALDTLQASFNHPEVLSSFFAADADKGCASCWVSSGTKEHKDCKTKIARYFAARDALVQYGLTL